MIQERYGKDIRREGDALLRAYVRKRNVPAVVQKTGIFSDDSSSMGKQWRARQESNLYLGFRRPS